MKIFISKNDQDKNEKPALETSSKVGKGTTGTKKESLHEDTLRAASIERLSNTKEVAFISVINPTIS